jgi:hypothetical protein
MQPSVLRREDQGAHHRHLHPSLTTLLRGECWIDAWLGRLLHGNRFQLAIDRGDMRARLGECPGRLSRRG